MGLLLPFLMLLVGQALLLQVLDGLVRQRGASLVIPDDLLWVAIALPALVVLLAALRLPLVRLLRRTAAFLGAAALLVGLDAALAGWLGRPEVMALQLLALLLPLLALAATGGDAQPGRQRWLGLVVLALVVLAPLAAGLLPRLTGALPPATQAVLAGLLLLLAPLPALSTPPARPPLAAAADLVVLAGLLGALGALARPASAPGAEAAAEAEAALPGLGHLLGGLAANAALWFMPGGPALGLALAALAPPLGQGTLAAALVAGGLPLFVAFARALAGPEGGRSGRLLLALLALKLGALAPLVLAPPPLLVVLGLLGAAGWTLVRPPGTGAARSAGLEGEPA